MKKIRELVLHCCTEEKKCAECQPEWVKRHFIEKDEELPEGERYTVFIPLMGIDDCIRAKMKHFVPVIYKTTGVWYIDHRNALKIYKGKPIADLIQNRVSSILEYIRENDPHSTLTEEEAQQYWDEVKEAKDE